MIFRIYASTIFLLARFLPILRPYADRLWEDNVR